jgi:hypothetical protein
MTKVKLIFLSKKKKKPKVKGRRMDSAEASFRFTRQPMTLGLARKARQE